MGISMGKKGFAFTFLALFLSFLMFAFATYFLSGNNYSQNEAFVQSRISQISSEIGYFQNNYLKTAGAYALYSSLDAILNSSYDSSFYSSINNNYSKFNSLIQEGMINESFNSIHQSSLTNKSLEYFISEYKNQVEKSLNINLTYKIQDINVYEKNPFYVSVQIHLDFQIKTNDNLSSWNISDTYEVSVPVYTFDDPEFVIQENLTIPIRPIELFASNINWDLSLLNETIDKTYSVVYLEPEHDYTLGSSFIKRFLNVSEGSFKDVLLRYSFDIDEEKGPVYNYVTKNPNGVLYGETALLMNFDNETLQANDLSGYNNSGIVHGATWLNQSCLNSKGCYVFNGISDYIEVKNSNSLNIKNKSFSVNIWVNSFGSVNEQGLFAKRELGNSEFVLSWTTNDTIKLFVDNGTNTITEETFEKLQKNKWNMITLNVNPQEIGSLYLNGKEVITFDGNIFSNFLNSAIYEIGSGDVNVPLSSVKKFNGSIDEISFYLKYLSDMEVTTLYSDRKASFVEYTDSLYGKGIRFDGGNRTIITNFNKSLNLINYSIGMWIMPQKSSSTLDSRQGIFEISNVTDQLRVFLNGFGKLEFDLLPGEIGNLQSDFSVDEWEYFVITSNQTHVKLYRNGYLVDSKDEDMTLYRANEGKISWLAVTNFFTGIVDELVIYNKTLSSAKVSENFHNYRSSVKSCCNYITLINPNSLGYNNPLYVENVSYSSKLFYDNYKRGIKNKVTLYNITDISSTVPSKNYFNFMLDLCLVDVYNVFSYNHTNQPAKLVQVGDFGVSCSGLIENGVY